MKSPFRTNNGEIPHRDIDFPYFMDLPHTITTQILDSEFGGYVEILLVLIALLSLIYMGFKLLVLSYRIICCQRAPRRGAYLARRRRKSWCYWIFTGFGCCDSNDPITIHTTDYGVLDPLALGGEDQTDHVSRFMLLDHDAHAPSLVGLDDAARAVVNAANPTSTQGMNRRNGRNRRLRFIKEVVAYVKSDIGTPKDTPANRCVIQRKASTYMRDRAHRANQMARDLPLIIEMVLTPGQGEVEARDYRTRGDVFRLKAWVLSKHDEDYENILETRLLPTTKLE